MLVYKLLKSDMNFLLILCKILKTRFRIEQTMNKITKILNVTVKVFLNPNTILTLNNVVK